MMLNEPNFKPSQKLLNLWICLPQNAISIGQNKVPPLFGSPKNFVFAYIFVSLLILIEIATIIQLSERGVSYTIMLVLTICDFVVAIIPPLVEQIKLDYSLAYIDAQLYINEIQLKYSNPEDKDKNSNLIESIRSFKSKRKVVKIILWIGHILIVGFCIWKFNTYYGIYKSKIWVNPAGRLVVITIILSLITHLTSTKIVLLDWLVRIKQKKEIKKKREGNATYSYTFNESHRKSIDSSFYKDQPVFIKKELANQKLLEKISKQDFNTLTPEEKKYTTSMPTQNDIEYFSTNESISKNATLLYSQLLKDEDLTKIVLNQKSTLAQETIAAYGKEIQLSQLVAL